MDIHLTPTPTKSPDDAEIDTPPHTAQPIKSHHLRREQPPLAVAYKECMKNHAAAIGGHAVDGCGEFMPSPSCSAADPTSLKCAACGCHRNFHRRETDSPTSAITPPFLDFRHPRLPKRFSLSPSPPSPDVFFGLDSLAAVEDHQQAPVTPTVENPVGRKRFRTKFSQEQKEKMHSFSVRLGWKLQKCDEAAVREFCREIGVSKGVLKVWMHNNKNTFRKKEIGGGVTNDGPVSFSGGGSGSDSGGARNSDGEKIGNNGNNFQNESGNGVHFHGINNGSSSSPA